MNQRPLRVASNASPTFDAASTQAYALARGLWPAEPASNDLRHALAELVQKHDAANPAAQIAFTAEAACTHCHCPCSAHAFGIAREAPVNAEKHAQAKCITVTLECRPPQLTLTVMTTASAVTTRRLPRAYVRRTKVLGCALWPTGRA